MAPLISGCSHQQCSYYENAGGGRKGQRGQEDLPGRACRLVFCRASRHPLQLTWTSRPTPHHPVRIPCRRRQRRVDCRSHADSIHWGIDRHALDPRPVGRVRVATRNQGRVNLLRRATNHSSWACCLRALTAGSRASARSTVRAGRPAPISRIRCPGAAIMRAPPGSPQHPGPPSPIK